MRKLCSALVAVLREAATWFGEVGPRVRTVLGLSKTSTSIGWVLVDGLDVAGDPLDHDAFDVDGGVADPAATARRARAIATATGYTVDCVRLTSCDNNGAEATSLRKALAESGFGEVVSVPQTEASRAWAQGVGRVNGEKTTAVCILDRGSVSLSVIDTRNGATKTTATRSRDSAGLIDWLSAAFRRNGAQPESLYLIGSRSDLDAFAGPLDEGLSVPVVATRDAQLALARGAALSNVKYVDDTPAEGRSGSASYARALIVVAAVAVASLFTLSSADSPIRLAERASQQAATPPVPEEPLPAPIPAPAATEAARPKSVATTVPEKVPVAPPAPHLSEVQPIQHMPEAQPAGLPGPAPVAPGPVASPPAAPIPPQSETAPPPPPDPFAQVLSPLFGAWP